MKILSMTATFGKLSHQTLTLQPGLNIVSAPNEWGKSTWCAFIVAMLYGIDTRQQTTKTQLADKERFAPWSGEPMSGRMEIDWNGRRITIERSTKGRVPFGEFRAYETETGLEVPELTAANCGQMLLGVERSVFSRAGFIRLQDMPVTQDDSLRRRLNNLVTTGDEAGAGDQLGKQLRDLKNKVRYNRSGLLPQAEVERDNLRAQFVQKESLQQQSQQLKSRQKELENRIAKLTNHADALRYEASKQGAVRIALAEEACQKIGAELTDLEALCAGSPDLDGASAKLSEGVLLREQQLSVASQQLPSAPVEPEIPAAYRDVTPEQAVADAKADFGQYQALAAKKKGIRPALPSIFVLILAAGALILKLTAETPLYNIISYALLPVALGVLLISLSKAKKRQALAAKIAAKHPGVPADQWVADAESYLASRQKYLLTLAQYQQLYGQATEKQETLNREIVAYAGDSGLEQAISKWETIVQNHNLLAAKQRELKNAREHLAALQAVTTAVEAPAFPDELTLSEPETLTELQDCRLALRTLQMQLGECIGQANTLPSEQILKDKLRTVTGRIARLEDYYKALELAQDVLYQATSALQRRFAPRISKRAQEYFGRLTGGRYDRITISDDLSLHASAQGEDTLRATAWRSDGTVDQLYLSLRLAVAGEVTPDAPLVLDDALVRFDDDRLAAALALLKEEAENKQVILFSCQNREKHIK